MSNGVNQKRLEQCKKISVKGYLLENHPELFRFGKDRATLIRKDNPDYVIYHDHAYVFTDGEKYPRRDNIDVLQDLFGYGFIDAVEHLEAWASKHNIITTDQNSNPVERMKRLDSIDASMCDGDEIPTLMNIPDGIDDVIDIPYD